MESVDELLEHLWNEQIVLDSEGQWLDNWLNNHAREIERDATAPFSDAGAALKRLRELGATHQDLAAICRAVSYEATFGTLYNLDYFGVTPNLGLYESLLTADPSGREGRPVEGRDAF